MDLKEFWGVVSSADWRLVLVAGLLHLATVIPSVVRWRSILEDFSIRTPFWKLTQICMIGYFFNMLLPSAVGGDFFRAFYLSRRESRGMSTTLTTTFVDRVAGLFAMLLIGLVSIIFYPVQVHGRSLLPLMILLSSAFSVGIVMLFHPWSHAQVHRLLERFGLVRLVERFELVYKGLNQLRGNTRTIIIITTSSLLIQITVIVAMWFAALSIGIRAPFTLFLVFIPLVNLSVAVPLTINGMGLREAVYFVLFSEVGVPVEAAVTLSLLNLAVVAMTAIPGGIVYSFYKKDEKYPVTDFSSEEREGPQVKAE
jgi:uncharacterized protein (TIRG00374 family)